MADQTVKFERDDVAAIAASLAQGLWFEENQAHPKASDADFLKLVAICAMALKGANPTHVHGFTRETFPKK